MTKQRILVLVFQFGTLITLTWLIVPRPALVKSVSTADPAWKVSVKSAFRPQESLTALNSANLWGKLADMAETLEPEPEWRFVGSMGRGQESHVIIKKVGQPEQTLKPGDSLPGGSKIVSIENDRLCILINGLKRSLYIYPQGRLSGNMSWR